MNSDSHRFFNIFLIGALGVVTQCWMFILIPSMVASTQTSVVMFFVIVANNLVAALLLTTVTDLMGVLFKGAPSTAVNTVFFVSAGFLNPIRNIYLMEGFNLAVTIQKFLSCFGMAHTWLELACIAMVVYTAPRMSVGRRLAIALVILPVAALLEVGFLPFPHA